MSSSLIPFLLEILYVSPMQRMKMAAGHDSRTIKRSLVGGAGIPMPEMENLGILPKGKG